MTYVGLDLGWTTGHTGVAVVEDTGRLVTSGRVRTDDEILGWLTDHAPTPYVVAVDAPLVVPNETGQRLPETLMARTFGRFGASAHTSNRAKFGGDPRALRLADRLGWSVDPDTPVGPGTTVCLEVYPHPALVGLFGLPYRLAYKKGRLAQRLPGFVRLLGLLGSVPELGVAEHSRWAELTAIVAAPGPGDLDRIEDELDAILCAHLAWLWHHRREALHVYGSLADGYIVAPPPPTHAAQRPTPAPPPSYDGLHHVQLAVPAGAEDRCRAFWGGVLGLTELAKPPALAARGGCWFRGGGLEVHLGVEEPFSPSAKAHPGILVRGLDALATRLTAHGVPVTWDDDFPGMRRFYSRDPEGNRLEFLEPRTDARP